VLGEARERLKRTDTSLLTATLILAALYFARAVFVPLALAGLLAFLLRPAASWLERRGARRTPAGLLVIFIALAGTAALGWVTLGQIYNLAIELPRYQENISKKITSLHLHSEGKLTSTVEMLTKLNRQIAHGSSTESSAPASADSDASPSANEPKPSGAASPPATAVPVRVEQPQESITTEVGRTIVPILSPLTTTLIVVIFLVFMLLGREDLLNRGLRLAGMERIHLTITAIEDASQRVSRYLLMQLVVNLSYGAIAGVSLGLIGIPHPLLWAVLTCVLRFVPYVGILMAAAGPVLLSIAASPRWSTLAWTVLMYAVLELVAGNFVEPMLYGASTGMSAIAIMIAAIFWTILWGFPGLLLSIPLTVCLVVLGRQVPHLSFLEVLFGEEKPLPAADSFYQRILAGNTYAARTLIEGMLKTQSTEEVYDSVLVPTLTQIEEARHSEQMTGSSAEELLQGVEEIAEELNSHSPVGPEPNSNPKRVVCVPARDFADEVACQLALQVLADTAAVRVASADASISDLLESMGDLQPNAICVIGVPPHSIRHLRMRCQQIRKRVPDALVVACVLSRQSDLSNLRSRIGTEDAHHVVHSMQLLKEYLISLLHPPALQPEPPPDTQEKAVVAVSATTETPLEPRQKDVFDEPEEGRFERLATNLAGSFDAPIAVIASADGRRYFWEAQCGFADDILSAVGSVWDLSQCSKILFSDSTLVLPDTLEDECFANDPFLKPKGVRFYAGAPLKGQDGVVIGTVCVLDTRPRQITEQQKEKLIATASAVMTAIELHGLGKAEGEVLASDHSPQLVP
jgi:predicted PurR-regulated permease PerM